MNKKNTLFVLAALLVGAMVLSACGQAPLAQASAPAQTTPQQIRTLTVSGTCKVMLVPDVAYINIGVHSEAEDVSTALSSNNDLALAIKDALKSEGIEDKDFQTSNFNVYPSDQYDPTTGQYIRRNYAVDNTLYVTVRDIANLGKLLDTTLRAGANNIYGITFDIQNKEAALAQARDLAIADAKAKAEATAATVGVELGQIYSVNVTNTSYVSGVYQSGYGMGGGGDKALESTVPVSAGQIVVTFDASLVYEIK